MAQAQRCWAARGCEWPLTADPRCAGGQCKRVNIGIALVTNPRVLFLDEPTSGLDSYTSNEVMTVVKTLTKTGITICATIHNPTPYCFNLFDRLMILLHGRVVYSGENGVQRMLAPLLLLRTWARLFCRARRAVLGLPARACSTR